MAVCFRIPLEIRFFFHRLVYSLHSQHVVYNIHDSQDVFACANEASLKPMWKCCTPIRPENSHFELFLNSLSTSLYKCVMLDY